MKCPSCSSNNISNYKSHYDFIKATQGVFAACVGLIGRISRTAIESNPGAVLLAGFEPSVCNSCHQVMMTCPKCGHAIPLNQHPYNLEEHICPGCKSRVCYGDYHELGGG